MGNSSPPNFVSSEFNTSSKIVVMGSVFNLQGITRKVTVEKFNRDCMYLLNQIRAYMMHMDIKKQRQEQYTIYNPQQ